MALVRSLGDMLHLAAIIILLTKMLRQRSAAGVSLKSMFLFALVFTTRYVDLFLRFYGVYNSVMKVLYLSSSYYICYLVKFRSPWKATYDAAGDSFKIQYLIGPCAALSLLLMTRAEEFSVTEMLWVFSQFLEAVAVLPQIFLLETTERYDVLTTHYLLCLGLYRALYLIHWILRKVYYNKFNTLSVVCGVVQTLLYMDFFYQYFKVAVSRNHPRNNLFHSPLLRTIGVGGGGAICVDSYQHFLNAVCRNRARHRPKRHTPKTIKETNNNNFQNGVKDGIVVGLERSFRPSSAQRDGCVPVLHAHYSLGSLSSHRHLFFIRCLQLLRSNHLIRLECVGSVLRGDSLSYPRRPLRDLVLSSVSPPREAPAPIPPRKIKVASTEKRAAKISVPFRSVATTLKQRTAPQTDEPEDYRHSRQPTDQFCIYITNTPPEAKRAHLKRKEKGKLELVQHTEMDNYQLNEEIGKGSFSTAYKGRRRRTTNFYAILSTDKCRRLRVLNSVHILRAVQHPCVIKFYNWFETNNHLWVITEFCAGGDLCSILKDTVMSETSLRVMGRDIATGLMHFHSMGYLYNDLKPDNLLMDSIPSLRFYDFGNSCPISLAAQRNLVGTPAYLAPELFMLHQGVVSMAADLWSLGCVLYEMATGSPPFAGNDLPTLLHNILTQPAPRAEKMSNEFNSLLAGLLEKDPRKRSTWTDVAASEFWEELLALPISGFPPEPAFAEYASQPARAYTEEQLSAAINAAVTAALANISPNSRKSEESMKTRNIALEELDFTPAATAAEAGHAAADASGKKRTPAEKAATPASSSAKSSKQAQLSKNDRAAGTSGRAPKEGVGSAVNPERSGSAELERDKQGTERMEVEEVCIEGAVSVEIRHCIWHHSDTHIRPLCMNARIERYIEPTLRREALPFPHHPLEELKQLGHEGITSFLGNAYRAMSNEKNPASRLNMLAYFEIICKDASTANILINSATMDFCYRMVDDASAPHELRAEAAMIIGQLVRHTTFIHQDVVRAGIIQRTMSLFTAETDPIVKRRLLVCLGELLFYVAVQTAAEREGWGIQPDPIQQLYVTALEADDDVLRHYAIKGIENVASVADRFMAQKLFATPVIVQRLISIYRTGQGTQSKGEHMRSSAMCAVCKLASASDALLPVVLQSKLFPLSEYPNAIKRSHIPLTSQLLLTLLVYGLHRSMELAKVSASAAKGSEDSPAALIHLIAGVSGRVLDSVRELNDRSTTAMRGKCLLLLCLLAGLGGSTLAQFCSPHFPVFLDRLMADKDSYVQQCVVPFAQSLNLYILEKLRALKVEVSSPVYVRTLRHLLNSTMVRKALDLDVEAFQLLGECLQKCLTSSSHNTYEDEFHSVVERFLAPEFAQTKLQAICSHLIPPLLNMIKVKNNASHFFAIRLLYTFVSSLLAEYPNTPAEPPAEALGVVTNAATSIGLVLPELIQEAQPVPSHTFRLLTACGEWNIATLEPIFTEECLWQLVQYLATSNNTDQMRPLQLLHMMLSQHTELIRSAFERGIYGIVYNILSQANGAESISESACSVAAALFTVNLDEATLGVIRKRVANPDLESLIRLLLGFCADDRLCARYASSAIEGIVRVSPLAQQTVLGTAGMEVLIPSLQTLIRAMRFAAREGVAYPALGQEAGLLLALHNTQVQGWVSTDGAIHLFIPPTLLPSCPHHTQQILGALSVSTDQLTLAFPMERGSRTPRLFRVEPFDDSNQIAFIFFTFLFIFIFAPLIYYYLPAAQHTLPFLQDHFVASLYVCHTVGGGADAPSSPPPLPPPLPPKGSATTACTLAHATLLSPDDPLPRAALPVPSDAKPNGKTAATWSVGAPLYDTHQQRSMIYAAPARSLLFLLLLLFRLVIIAMPRPLQDISTELQRTISLDLPGAKEMLRHYLRPETDQHATEGWAKFLAITAERAEALREANGTKAPATPRDNSDSEFAGSGEDGIEVSIPQIPISSTYKESSILFPEAHPVSFEPKVQVPYVHVRGAVPREIEIERRRRLYDEIKVQHLVNVSKLTLKGLAEKSAQKIPLEIFDDTSYDCHNPKDWMAIADVSPEVNGKFLPAEGVYEDDGLFELRPCRVVGWIEDRNEVQIKWGPQTTQEDKVVTVPRIFVRLLAEDPIVYMQRLVNAHHQREKATSWILYRLCCDAMPVEGLEPLNDTLASRLRHLGTCIPQLSEKEFPEVKARAEKLIEEITLEWQRSHNRILLQDRMKKDDAVLRMVGRGTHMSLEELMKGPNVAIQRSGYGDPGTVIYIEGSDYQFDERERSFNFSTYFTQPQVVTALTGVRRECIKVLEGSLFDLPKERQMPLEEFQKRQMTHMDKVTHYLKNDWLHNICNVIRTSFESAGKGWLNVTESKQEIYELSKLKKFFTTVKFMMEDTLFELVYTSLHDFTEFFEEVSDFTVAVMDMNHAKNSWPGSDADDCVEKQPLFTINLVESENRFAYDIPFDTFQERIVDLFNNAIKCTEAIPQVERYVMSQYFWRRDGDGPFLDSVRQGDEQVVEMRARVRQSVKTSLEPLQVYLATYDELLPLVRLDKDEFIKKYAEEEHSMEEMKEEINKHLWAKRVVADRIPQYLTVGNYVVDCQSFSYVMSKKEEDLARLVMQLIGKLAKKQTQYVREEFNKIVRVLEKEPQNPEKLYELYAFIESMKDTVVELGEHIEEMRQYYAILDSFQYELTDDESKVKWEAILWPRQLALRTAAVMKNLENVQEELHTRLQKDQEEFAKRVEHLQRVVATFSKYTDATESPKVAAEVKTHNIEIRQCIETARAINSDQRLFGDKMTDYRNVFELDKEFKPYSDLWLTTYGWQEAYRRWHADAFDTLDPEEIDQTVTNSYKVMNQLAKTFKDKQATYRIVDEIRTAIEGFKPIAPIVVSLRHPGMKDRHWKDLSEKLGMKLAPGETLLLIEDCEPLLPHKETIVSFCEVAAKEMQIEKALKDMRTKWETKFFVIEAYKETGTSILKDTTEITEMLDEHLNLTQQLLFSPFKAFFEEAITDWDRSLNLISDVLEQWMDCQRAWRYLEPIFSSEDIAMQLPMLTKLFEKVDKVWRRTMHSVSVQPNVLEFCIGTNKLLDQLREANRTLEEVQRGLNDYLADKRQTFPRFYFLSDEELLGILSQSKEVRKIDANIAKLFEFIAKLEWTDDNKITGYFSGEGEYVKAVTPVTPEGNVEVWLRLVEDMMKDAVHEQVRLSYAAYLETERTKWVLDWPAQNVIVVSQIFWTQGCEEALSTKGHVEDYFLLLDKQLFDLVDVVQSPLTNLQRINMGALITIEVHAKDTVDAMQKVKVSSAHSFEWMKQLRFYFDESDGFCHIRQVDAHFIYGGEYLGNTGRLVVTPLTDRIYLTLTGALALCLGGAPAGPAGTGKTETTKDLAKALAKQCVVFNCQEGMTYLSMAKFFKGLAWCGAWACFDEFNRIDVEVLSVVAQQVTDLQQACVTKQYRIMFEQSDIVVDPTHAVFITMNPGYAGRTELPDNLKVLFRPVACMVPDYAMIGEIRLFSYGYKKARALAQKMVMTFKLSSEQLSSQDHYDFGMRAVNTVISAAGLNKRENPGGDEDVLLLRALRDSNVPKFLKSDILLFEGIISDLFPGTELPTTDYGKMVEVLQTAVKEVNYQPVPAFIEKCLQLYDITTLRHGLMLVGPAGSGKTTAYTTLQRALTKCSERQAKGEDMGQRDFMKVYTHICNPKSVTMDQLYGAYDENGEWTDGILCVLFRCAAQYGDEGNLLGKHWVMFDGPVDALWIESMNTVLDENKKLCLVSGEIITMNRDMTMMFEVEDLAVASPATVSRCGMIYLDPATCVPTQVIIESWIAELPHYMVSQKERLHELATLYLDIMLDIAGTLPEYVNSTKPCLTHGFIRMINGFIHKFEAPKAPAGQPVLTPDRQDALDGAINQLFFFSVVWSVGSACDDKGREIFNNKFIELIRANGHEEYLPPGNLYDYCYIFYALPQDEEDVAGWKHWQDCREEFLVANGMKFEDIIVPTVDNTRQNYVLHHLLMERVNVAAVGPTGTGKSVSVSKLVLGGGMPSNFLGLTFTFSAQTKAMVVQEGMMAKFDKRRSHVYGAPAGKHFLVFVDDANLPQQEKYGAQPPLELLRQLLGQGGFYSLTGGIKWSSIIDTSLVLAMGPPGGGRSKVSNRFMRFFNYVAFPEMSEVSKRDVLNTILQGGFMHRGVPEEVREFSRQLVESTLKIFTKCFNNFLPTPAHVFYSFNLRDVMRVFPMIYQAEAKTLETNEELTKMWMHETQRVFFDRLINEEDKNTFIGFLNEELKDLGFEKDYREMVEVDRLIYGDFIMQDGIYEQMKDLSALSTRFYELLRNYNDETETKMNLVLFLDAIEHVCRISRVLRMPNGHCLLLGVGGSGRKSLTRLACYLIPSMEVFTVEITKNFGLKEWHESLAKLLLDCGKDEKKRTFLFSDTQLVRPVFLEDVAGLLTSGDVPNLFEDQDVELINEKFRGVCVSENLPTTKVSVYARFIKEVRSNLHIALAFSPIGEAFRNRLRMFPSLIACCTIDWFAEWPAEALLSVAKAQLEVEDETELEPALVEKLSECFEFFHLSAAQVTEKFFQETRRRSYVTPTSFLSLLNNYTTMLARKETYLREQRSRLENGLDKLRETEQQVAELELMLKAQQPVLEAKKADIKVMMAQLAEDREVARVKEVDARKEESAATLQEEECTKMAKECEAKRAEAEPILQAALQELRKLQSKELVELAKLASQAPPAGVKLTLSYVAEVLEYGVCPKAFMNKKEADWLGVARTYLKDPNGLLAILTSKYDKSKMGPDLIAKIEKQVTNPKFDPEVVKGVSVPCAAMCKWVHSMHKWYFVNQTILPLEEMLNNAKEQLAQVRAALRETRMKLDEVIASVAKLEKDYTDAVNAQTELENEMEKTTMKLSRAARLINGLSGEKQRWIELVAMYKEQEQCVVGDMLIAAATWCAKLKELNIRSSEDVGLVATSGDPVQIQEWQICGLPSDALSTENAIILSNSRNWPLLIDPQGQANNWIRNIHRDDNLQVCKASDDKFMKTIENSIRLGLPCLLENVGNSLEAALEPVLLKIIFLIGSTPHVRIGDSAIPYDRNFKLYMTTKLPNPSYTPETIVTVSLLNFFITPSGLEDQLLGKTVEKERNDLEVEKQKLTRDNADKNRELKELQDNILRMLQEAEGDILEQEDLILTLEKSKVKSTEIGEDLQKAKETEKVIDETRNKYRPHAIRGALLFFCVSSLAIIDPMYQFSLQWFMNLFLNGIDNTEQTEDVEERVHKLMDYFTYSFYCNVCRSLFEKHKLTFSFFLCTRIIDHDGLINQEEFRFLLTGPTGSGGAMTNPAPEWLTENNWNEIQFASANVPSLMGFAEHVTKYIDHYKNLFDSNDADTFPLAGEYKDKETPMQRLVVTRLFRKDKGAPAIQHFVRHYIGERFIIVPQFDLMDAYKDSDAMTPLIFINSPGSDPMNDLLRFAETMRMTKKLDKVSLGQGQGRKAEELIVNASEKGQWVLLQNCHLATSWMPTLEMIVEGFSPETVKKEFRLWLTSMPSDSFPVAVLQIAVKMTNEPPMGLRANVTRSYFGLTDEDLEHEDKPQEFKRLVFSLCLFHGVIQERRKFGSLGFNIAYEFNDSDRKVCLLQLRKFLSMYDEIPYDVLTFLTGEINYGGRVTDDWDRRCMMTMILHYMCPEILEEGYKFSPSGTYATIEVGNRKHYLDYLDTWPLNPLPEVFGLHDNADITCAQNTTNTILATVLSLVSRGGGGTSDQSRDQLLLQTANGIITKLPHPFDEAAFMKKYPTKYEESMNTVLLQEAIRYNRLLRFIHNNLNEFIKAVKGEVVMSAELEAVGSSFFINEVPASWAGLAYPSLKPLSSWVEDLVLRVAFIQSWYDSGAPKVYWMGGFFFPQAFLTGTLQNYARQVQAAIDTISFSFHVLPTNETVESAQAVERGALVYGLFIEGARWDGEEHTLTESRPKELYTDMPILHFDPIINRVPDKKDYVCPVYKTLTRAGTLSTTGHSTNFVLPIEIPTKEHPNHWIERGVACIVSLNF
eukprot:gene8354-5852_t